MEGPPETLWQTGQAKTVPSFQPAGTMGKYTRRHTASTPKDWPTGRKNSQISVTISGGRPTGKILANKPSKSVPSFQPAGTMGSTTEVTVSTPKTYQTAKKNTAFARRASQRMAKASRLFNLLVPWEVPRKLPLAPQRLTKQRRKTPHLLA